MSDGLLAGTLTFLFTDIEDSTRHLRTLRGRYGELIAGHAQLVRAAIERFGGREVDTQGDAFFAVFSRARDAVAAAASLQVALHSHPWPEGARLRVRIGIHTGEPEVAGDRYFGLDIHLAARICAVARGGETLLSGLSASLVRDQLPDGTALAVRGPAELKGFAEPEVLYRLVIGALPDIDEPHRRRPPEQEPALPFSGSHEELARRVTTGIGSRSPRPAAGGPLAVVGVSPAGLEALVPFARLLARAEGAELPACRRRPAGRETARGGARATARPARGRGHRGAGRGVSHGRSGRRSREAPAARGRRQGRRRRIRARQRVARPRTGRPPRSWRPRSCCTSRAMGPRGRSRRSRSPAATTTGRRSSSRRRSPAARGARILVAGTDRGTHESDDASRLLATASLVAQQLTNVVPELLLLPPGAEAVLAASGEDAHIVTGVPPDFRTRDLGTSRADSHVGRPGRRRSCCREGRNRRDGSVTRFSWTLTTADLGP